MLAALQKEILLRKNYLPNLTIATLYFGGGTPSLLTAKELGGIIDVLHTAYNFSPDIEITLEANPDDITPQKVKEWKTGGINRLSIGIQSFFEEDLKWMNRAHTQSQAQNCIPIAQQSGIENITADLIFGYPLLTDAKWETNIQTLLALGIPHISAYSLTVEPKTALALKIAKGAEPSPMPEQAARQFETLMDTMAQQGWEHYEISNYCQPGHYARHNTNYWKNKPYLGIGPSAHSYNGSARQYNVANNALYIKAIENNTIPAEIEILTPTNLYNEYIMAGLRTQWGININQVQLQWGHKYAQYLAKEAQNGIISGYLHLQDTTLTLTKKGKLLADYLASELFFEE